jgi:hypothetical protein
MSVLTALTILICGLVACSSRSASTCVQVNNNITAHCTLSVLQSILHASAHVTTCFQIDEGDDIPIEFETLLKRLKLQEPTAAVEVSQTEPDAAPNTLVLFRVTSNPVVTTTAAGAAAAATDDDRSSSNSNDAMKKKTSLQMSLICCNDQPYATQAVGQVTVTIVTVPFVIT